MQGETLVYDVIWGGTPEDTLDVYTALTGRPALPPAWNFGLWLSTFFITDYSEETATGFVDGMAQHGIPMSVLHFDCCWMRSFQWCDFVWDPEMFPDPEGMLKRYHERGLHISVWMNLYIAQRSPLFSEAAEKGYLLRKTDGTIWQTSLWQYGMGILDVTNIEARRWYQEQLKGVLRMGVDCMKTDFGERIPVDGIVYHDGSDPLRMHNYYSYLYTQMVYEAIAEAHGPEEALIFARSATCVSQQYPLHWGGDNTASYLSMAESLRGGHAVTETDSRKPYTVTVHE